jgi:hypothetical protein
VIRNAESEKWYCRDKKKEEVEPYISVFAFQGVSFADLCDEDDYTTGGMTSKLPQDYELVIWLDTGARNGDKPL